MKIQLWILLLSILFVGCKKFDSDPFNSWQIIYQDTTVWMTHMRFLDENTGFVLAGNRNVVSSLRGKLFVFKTNDAGKTWVKYACEFPTKEDNARMIAPLNSYTLIALGNRLCKSTDNGFNWVSINPDYKGSGFFDVYIKDTLNWVLAEGNYITITTDGGKTFKRVFSTEFVAPFDQFAFPSSMVGYAIGGATYDFTSFGFIAKTIDGGESWLLLNAEPWHSNKKPFPDCYTIQFITTQTGFIFTLDGKLYKTIDGGNNWTLIYDKQDNYSYTKSWFISENIGYYSEDNRIYSTEDGGRSWHNSFTIPLNSNDSYFVNMYFLKSGVGYAITPDSKIVKKN